MLAEAAGWTDSAAVGGTYGPFVLLVYHSYDRESDLVEMLHFCIA